MNKEEVIIKLKSLNIDGMDNMIEFMLSNGFFESPASTKYHGCRDNGLLDHSVHLYKYYMAVIGKFKAITPNEFLDCPTDSDIFLCAMVHDFCKVGAYVKIAEGNYSYKTTHPKGHAMLSIDIVKKYIKLTSLQEAMIRFHMGYYGTHQFDINKGEYDIQALRIAQNNRYVKLFYFADDTVSQFWDK